MSKYFLMYRSYSERGIMGEGRLFRFTINGKALGESALDFNCMSQEEIDLLSILVTNGHHIEFGFNVDGVFTKQVSKQTLPTILRRLNEEQGVLFMGSQNGKVGTDICNQYLYAFKKGTLNKAFYS